MDRRAVFFLIAAVACFALIPAADVQYRSLAGGLGVVYVLLAIASFADYRADVVRDHGRRFRRWRRLRLRHRARR